MNLKNTKWLHKIDTIINHKATIEVINIVFLSYITFFFLRSFYLVARSISNLVSLQGFFYILLLIIIFAATIFVIIKYPKNFFLYTIILLTIAFLNF